METDPNHDGIDNLTAYAFDLPPLGALTETELARLPQLVRQNDNTLRFEFTQNALLTDISYEVETSVDLKTWELASSEIISQDDNIERHGVRINENEPRRFYRVKLLL
ncbi:MAG: hypothetical protein LBV12_11145 [Puniceicoccales bacterium]|nr:hypothetical protein [Puniceicoccales bacterium]